MGPAVKLSPAYPIASPLVPDYRSDLRPEKRKHSTRVSKQQVIESRHFLYHIHPKPRRPLFLYVLRFSFIFGPFFSFLIQDPRKARPSLHPANNIREISSEKGKRSKKKEKNQKDNVKVNKKKRGRKSGLKGGYYSTK